MKKNQIKKQAQKEKTKPLKLPRQKKGEKTFIVQGPHGVLVSKDHRHLDERYKVKQIKGVDGKITIEMTPFKRLQARRAELVKNVAEALAKNVDNLALMKDVLQDTNLSKLEALNTAVKRGAKVKSKEGCFFLSIKDPRKKKPYQLNLRK